MAKPERYHILTYTALLADDSRKEFRIDYLRSKFNWILKVNPVKPYYSYSLDANVSNVLYLATQIPNRRDRLYKTFCYIF